MADPDDEKAQPQTMPDKPGDDPREDTDDEQDRLPRGQHGPSASYGDDSDG